MYIHYVYTENAVTEDRTEWQGKTFKSGNSVALRLPKGLGVPEGLEVNMVREAPMTFRVEPVTAPKRKFNIDKVRGCAIGSGLRFIEPHEREFEPRPSRGDAAQHGSERADGE
jgi:antitoxin VapB